MGHSALALRFRVRKWIAALGLGALMALCCNAAVWAADPIKIGFSTSLTGGLASSGKANLLAQQIWQEHVNAQGGLLGRQVDFVYYDDQSKADTVPGIYAKLIDVDKVDLLMGAATNLIVAAMPEIMQRQKMVMVLVALGSNDEFKYPRYFQTAAWGPDAKGVIGNAFFEVAKTISPRPKDRRHRRGRHRVLQQCHDRRARQREEAKASISSTTAPIRPDHDRLFADRARHPGGQSRSGFRRVVSARLGRHGPRGDRTRLEDANCSAAPWSACNTPPSCSSSPTSSTGS